MSAITHTLLALWNGVKRVYATLKGFYLFGFHKLPAPLQRFLGRHRWKVTITVVVIVLLSYGYYSITKEPEPEIITAEVTRGNLEQTVEAVGELTSERALNLQFPVSGVVLEVLVKEGDVVEQGIKLASLRAYDLAANVQSALANLQAAQAQLTELQEGTRPEDIVVAEAELINMRAQLSSAEETLRSSQKKLEIVEREATVSLQGEIGKARSSASQQLTRARTAISVYDDVMSDVDVFDAFLRGAPGKDRLMKKDRDAADAIITDLYNNTPAVLSYEGAVQGLLEARKSVAITARVLEELFTALSGLPPTSSFTRSERETRKTDIATEKTNIQTALTTLDASIKSLQDAAAGFDTKIATEQTTITNARGDILNLETSIRTEEAQLALAKAGSRPTEIQASSARVRAARADYERAKADFEDTVLYAPVRGSITKVNIKEGELLSTAFQQDAAITMLGESPYRIEMYASEVDIPKVQLSQSGSVELDAFPGRFFSLTVGEIDPAASDIDGVPKYRIKLDFVEIDNRFKIGMTGDVDIITGRVEDVLTVPARAVLENEFGDTYIRIQDRRGNIEERRVEIGLEGENDVEIIKGLEEGETVVVLLKK